MNAGDAEAREDLRRAAEAERDRLRTLLSEVPAIINVLRGPDLVFEFAHPMTVRVLGGRDIVGKPLLEAIPEFRDQEYPALLRRVLETGERIEGKTKLARLDVDGSGILRDTYWDFVYLPVRDENGRVEGVMTFNVDVTERTQAEAAQRRFQRQREELLEALSAAQREAELASKAKDEFLATLGHELRTPVAAILLWASALRSRTVPSDQLDRAVDAILQSAKTQSRLIDDLLDLSRLALGKLSLAPTRTAVADVARAAIDVVQPTSEAKHQKLELELAEGLGSALLDPARLQQILWNLLTNAVKFTPEGGKITLRLRKRDGMLEAEVADTGEGISKEFLPHVFERFRQKDMGDSRQHAGLGIGLALSRKLVELHGGTIDVHSDGPGRGSVFSVRLPCVDAGSMRHDSPKSAPEHTSPTALAGLTVLLVEDDANTCDAMTWTLAQAGARVLPVASGAEALAVLEGAGSGAGKPLPDVIVSDLGLPGMSGYELIERIVKQRRALGHKPLPACAVSAHAREVDRRRAIDAGFDLYLAKPVVCAQLIEAVQDLKAVSESDQS